MIRSGVAAAGADALAAAVQAATILIVAAMFLAFTRLVRGPDVVDRIVALDLIAILAAAITVVTAIRTGEAVLLDAALVMALIGFVATVALSRYVESRSDT